MYFIKCAGCGQYNAVKSEYQTFCEYCNVKLSNNYTLWKKRNPKGTFEQFQEKECFSYEQKLFYENSVNQSQKKKVSPALLVLGLILLIFIGLGTAGYLLKPYVVSYASSFLEDKQDAIFSSLNKSKWETYSCGHLGLSLDSPSPIVEDKQQLIPEQYKQMMHEMSVFTMENPLLKVQISASSIQYAKGVETSLEGAKEGLLNQLKQNLGSGQFQSTDTPYELNNIPGILTKGMVKSEESPLGFQVLSLMDGLNLWQVMVVYDNSVGSGNALADRVINSVQIDRL